MKSKIIAAVILGSLIALAVIVRPFNILATSSGNYISSLVQTGSFTATSSNGTQNYIEQCDSFSPTFSSTPNIQVSIAENTTGSITTAAPETVEIYSASTTGFCVRIGSRDNSNFANNFSVNVNWTAVGN